MTSVTLLTKIYSTNQRKQIDEVIKDLFEGLSVETTIKSTATDNWVHVTLTGEDEAIAKNLLNREFGFCPATLENVEEGSTLKGYVAGLEKNTEKLFVDMGVFQPKTAFASMNLSHLQAQLASGKKVPLKKIAEFWGICENLPLTIKVVHVDVGENRVDAELSPEQMARFELWRDSLLDRLLVLGASHEQVKAAIEQAQLERDIIDVEALGMFEYALVCKLGTDAAGLISRIGRRLWKAKFTVFNPKRTIEFTDSPA